MPEAASRRARKPSSSSQAANDLDARTTAAFRSFGLRGRWVFRFPKPIQFWTWSMVASYVSRRRGSLLASCGFLEKESQRRIEIEKGVSARFCRFSQFLPLLFSFPFFSPRNQSEPLTHLELGRGAPRRVEGDSHGGSEELPWWPFRGETSLHAPGGRCTGRSPAHRPRRHIFSPQLPRCCQHVCKRGGV